MRAIWAAAQAATIAGWLAASLAASSALAWVSRSTQAAPAAEPARVYYDQQGFPRCIANAADGSDGVLLLWDDASHYQREIYAASLADPRFAAFRQQAYPLGCQHWPSFHELATEDVANWTSYYDVVPAGAHEASTRFGVYALPPEALERLAQAREGARAYRGSLTPAEYLRQRPMAAFSRADNQRLSAEFGVGFAADVYKLWMESLPRNREMKASIRGYVAQAASGRIAVPTAHRYAGFKILVAEGYMQTPRKNRLETFYRALRSMGIEYESMRFEPLGTLQANAASFEAQIEHALRTSRKRIILTAASKGVPELLLALSSLGSREPALAARVAAVLNMAGMFEGSFLVDWASHGIQSLLVSSKIGGAAKAAGLEMRNLDGFYAMSTASLSGAANAYSRRLPNLLYFNFVGVLTRDGLARDAEIRTLQASLTIPRLGSSSGANDGYIEYPGTMMPRSWGLNSTEIVFDSSHAIIDGFYDGRDLKSERERRIVFDGVFQAIADRIQAGSR